MYRCCKRVRDLLEDSLKDEIEAATWYMELASAPEIANDPEKRHIYMTLYEMSLDELKHFGILTYITRKCGFDFYIEMVDTVGMRINLRQALQNILQDEQKDHNKYIKMARLCSDFMSHFLYIARDEEGHYNRIRDILETLI